LIDSVTPVAFGLYDTDSGVEQTSSGEIRFSCKPANKTVTVTVAIGPSGISGTIADRSMRGAGSGDELHYNLFQDPRGTVVWGDGTNGGSPAVVTGVGSFSLEIFGVAHPNQSIGEDIYADVLQVTIQN
jgi:spore coat protein U-like protein